jgi:hypothetical protein
MNFRGMLAAVLLWAGSHQPVLGADRADVSELLKQPWVSLKLSFEHHGGDESIVGPTVLIQRLPDKRVLLSYGAINAKESWLVPWRLISEDEVSRIVTQTRQFWEKAKKESSSEERITKLPPAEKAIVDGINAKFATGPMESTMKVQISTEDKGEGELFVDSIEESANDWMEFLKKAAGAKS